MCNCFRNNFFIWASGSFKGWWAVHSKEDRMSWCLDPSITDTVEPCFYEFLCLDPHVSSRKSGFLQGKVILCLTQP